jgi:hypothetical protein
MTVHERWFIDEATGSYVLDSHNGWAEIHPVSTFSK